MVFFYRSVSTDLNHDSLILRSIYQRFINTAELKGKGEESVDRARFVRLYVIYVIFGHFGILLLS